MWSNSTSQHDLVIWTVNTAVVANELIRRPVGRRLYVHMYPSPLIAVCVCVFFFQIMLLTRYWTKFNVAFVCVSVVFFFICSRITQSTRLFERSPSDYFFIGTLLLISAQGAYSIRFCHLSVSAPGCGHFNIHYCRNRWTWFTWRQIISKELSTKTYSQTRKQEEMSILMII